MNKRKTHWQIPFFQCAISLALWLGLTPNLPAGTFTFTQIWYDTNLFSGSDIQNGGFNRSLAYSAAANQLFVANRSGSAEGISVLSPANGSVLGTVNGAGPLQPDQILTGDDGVLYAIPLDQTLNGNNLQIFSWTNWNNAPYQCYVPSGSDGTSQGIVSGYRVGDTAAIVGAGTNTVILCGVNHGVSSTNCVLLFGTADGVNFSAKLLCITNLPVSYSDLGPAHGYSFYTNGTFIFKPGGSSAYLIRYPANFASLPNLVYVGAIATNSLSGNSVVTDFSPAANVLATLQLPQGAGNDSTIVFYSLASFTGSSNVGNTFTANPIANGNDTGGIVLGGPGKTNLLFTLDSNNGVYGWNLVPGTVVETGIATPAALQAELETNTQGTAISLEGIDPLSCPQISMTQTYTGGKLIFSDSPESPASPGMLYSDTNLPATSITVPNRVFAYHVNSNSSGQMKFSVLIKNNGASPATLTVKQSGLAGPSTSYAVVGETAFYRWLTNTAATSMTVAPGQTVRLDTNFDSTTVRKNFLMHGIWDYTFPQPHSVMICALNPADDPVSVGPALSVEARDSHVRGTFVACNKSYASAAGVVIDMSQGIQQFPLAGSGDSYVTGYDNAVAVPTAETDFGNYGLLYNVQLTTSASDSRALGIVLTPRGGAWNGAVNADPGLLPGGPFIIPAGGITISATTQAAIEGEYYPDGGKIVKFQFMPTGASSFPIQAMTVPFSSIAPDLAAISNYSINVGQTVTFTANAMDSNGTPPLSFSLPVAPVGAGIGSGSGIFQWRATVASAGSTQNVQVRVGDGGSPQLSDVQAFTIAVNPLAPVFLKPAALANAIFQLQASGTVGPDYVLQGNTAVNNPNGWTNLLTNTPITTPFTLTDTNAGTFSNRFYRVLLGP